SDALLHHARGRDLCQAPSRMSASILEPKTAAPWRWMLGALYHGAIFVARQLFRLASWLIQNAEKFEHDHPEYEATPPGCFSYTPSKVRAYAQGIATTRIIRLSPEAPGHLSSALHVPRTLRPRRRNQGYRSIGSGKDVDCSGDHKPEDGKRDDRLN